MKKTPKQNTHKFEEPMILKLYPNYTFEALSNDCCDQKENVRNHHDFDKHNITPLTPILNESRLKNKNGIFIFL
jgi:hypothetical protein